VVGEVLIDMEKMEVPGKRKAEEQRKQKILHGMIWRY